MLIFQLIIQDNSYPALTSSVFPPCLCEDKESLGKLLGHRIVFPKCLFKEGVEEGDKAVEK